MWLAKSRDIGNVNLDQYQGVVAGMLIHFSASLPRRSNCQRKPERNKKKVNNSQG